MSGSSESSPSPEPSFARFTRPQVELILEMFKGATFKKHEHLTMLEHLERLVVGMKEQERLGVRTSCSPQSQPILHEKHVEAVKLKIAELQTAHAQFHRYLSLAQEQSRLAQELQSEANRTAAQIERLESTMAALMCSSPTMEKLSNSASSSASQCS